MKAPWLSTIFLPPFFCLFGPRLRSWPTGLCGMITQKSVRNESPTAFYHLSASIFLPIWVGERGFLCGASYGFLSIGPIWSYLDLLLFPVDNPCPMCKYIVTTLHGRYIYN